MSAQFVLKSQALTLPQILQFYFVSSLLRPSDSLYLDILYNNLNHKSILHAPRSTQKRLPHAKAPPTIFAPSNQTQQSQRMKKSQQIISPTFLKKQSQIQKGTANQDNLPATYNLRNELQDKEMCNSQLHSEANSHKAKEHHSDRHDPLSLGSQQRHKASKETIYNQHQQLAETGSRQPLENLYQADKPFFQHENGQTKSHKKFGLGPFTLSEKKIRRGASNSNKGDNFLVIDSKKQKYNNNYMFLSDIDSLKQQIRKYEISIEKLKEENMKLKSEKIKLSSTNDSMLLIELRLELQAQKKRVKQLQTEKDLHLTRANKDQNTHNSSNTPNVQNSIISNANHQAFMTASRLEAIHKLHQREDDRKISAPVFRNNPATLTLNSPRTAPSALTEQLNEAAGFVPPLKIIQIIKSPHFLKKL